MKKWKIVNIWPGTHACEAVDVDVLVTTPAAGTPVVPPAAVPTPNTNPFAVRTQQPVAAGTPAPTHQQRRDTAVKAQWDREIEQ